MSKTAKFLKALKIFAWVVGIGLVLGVGGWYYFTTQQKIKRLEEQINIMKTQLKLEFENTLAAQDSFYLSFAMEPFGWAIRNELLLGNTEKIHQYLAQFVKRTKVEQIAVMDEEGKIISATNKKIEGKSFSEVYPDFNVEAEDGELIRQEGKIRMHKPIMGFDKRIGTVFLLFNPQTELLLPASLNQASSNLLEQPDEYETKTARPLSVSPKEATATYKSVGNLKTYCNRRYSFCLNYPDQLLVLSSGSMNADGITLSNADSSITLVASAWYNILDQSMDQLFQAQLDSSWLPDGPKPEVYRDSDSFIFKGTMKKGWEYWKKTIIRGDRIAECLIQFDPAKAPDHQMAVQAIMDSFHFGKENPDEL